MAPRSRSIQKPSVSDTAGTQKAAGQKREAPSTIDRTALSDIVAYVKRQRATVVLEAEKLDMLLLHAELRHEDYRRRSQTPVCRRTRAGRVVPRICELLHRKKDVVRAV